MISLFAFRLLSFFCFFFFNDTATTEIYTLSLHDALPILPLEIGERVATTHDHVADVELVADDRRVGSRSEGHTSELQSRLHLVCRLLLEKKKKKKKDNISARTQQSKQTQSTDDDDRPTQI